MPRNGGKPARKDHRCNAAFVVRRGRNGEVIGLIFDGNIQPLGGDFGYDGAMNRAVAVDVTGIVEALKNIYLANRLVKELSP